MTMRNFLLFGVALVACSSSVSAEPVGRWWSGYGMGTLEYGIKNDSAGSDSVYIACSGESTIVYFSVGGVDPKPKSIIIVTIGGEEWVLYTNSDGHVPTNNHVAADNFISLWHAMRSGTVMRVRLATGQSTRFTLAGSGRELPKKPCETDFYDR